MLKVAVKCEAHLIGRKLLDDEGNILGQDSGTTLLKRILSLFPNPVLIHGDEIRKTPWGEARPLHKVDCNNTVVINMDVMEAFYLYNEMKATPQFHFPKIVNFAWWNVSEFREPILNIGFSASCAAFPLFGNSPKVVHEIKDSVRKSLGVKMLSRMNSQFEYLGIDTEKVSTERRVDPAAAPIVQYPAMFCSPRKNQEQFMRIMEKVASRTPVRAVMRLHKSSYDHPTLEEFRELDWVDVIRVPDSKEEYYRQMEEESVFLACSKDESYGIAYVEAMYAGLVGVYRESAWIHQIIPEGYPFVFDNDEDAEAMMHMVLTQPERARDMVNVAAGGSIREWIERFHNIKTFDAAVIRMVNDFYPERPPKTVDNENEGELP